MIYPPLGWESGKINQYHVKSEKFCPLYYSNLLINLRGRTSSSRELTSKRCTTAEDLTPVYLSNSPLLPVGSTPDRLKFAYSVWALGRFAALRGAPILQEMGCTSQIRSVQSCFNLILLCIRSTSGHRPFFD
jgi:hypothetical protein